MATPAPAALPPPPAMVGAFVVSHSRRTGARYYHHPRSGLSVWHDDALPAGWAWGRDGASDDAPKFYVDLHSGARQADVPTAASTAAPAAAAAAVAAASPPADAGAARKRPRPDDEAGGAATEDATPIRQQHRPYAAGAEAVCTTPATGGPLSLLATPHVSAPTPSPSSSAAAAAHSASQPPPPPPPGALGDSPLLALLRQEWLSWHHRRFALGVGAHWPLPGDSKTLRCCRTEGLLPGLQGAHSRFLFAQLQAQEAAAQEAAAAAGGGAAPAAPLDPLLPHLPDTPDKDTTKELTAAGMPPAAAEALSAMLARTMATAAASCARVRGELVRQAQAQAQGQHQQQQQQVPTAGAATAPAGGSSGAASSDGVAADGTFDWVAAASGGNAGSALLLPAHGTLHLLLPSSQTPADAPAAPLPAASPYRSQQPPAGELSGQQQPPPQVLLVYTPSPEAVERYLAPVRAAAPIPPHPQQQPSAAAASGPLFYGPLTLPLYAGAGKPAVAARLAAAGVRVTPFTAALELNVSHYAKLCALLQLAAAADARRRKGAGAGGDDTASDEPPPTFTLPSTAAPPPPALLQRLFCVLARYETFSGNAGGIQGAVPHYVFDALENHLGVAAECFASPLNAHFPAFCSAFPDTDAPFGSRGSFFAFRPLAGAFEANPPFVNATMLAMARHIIALLDAAAAAGSSLLFFVIVPSWTDAYFFALLRDSRHTRLTRSEGRKAHEYIDGLQHRAGRCTWGANVDSTWFVLATDAAVAERAIGPSTAVALAAAFARTVADGADPPGRVFRHHPLPGLPPLPPPPQRSG